MLVPGPSGLILTDQRPVRSNVHNPSRPADRRPPPPRGPAPAGMMEVSRMVRSMRPLCAVAVLLAAWRSCPAADEPLSRVEIGKIGKAGTALVEVKNRGFGSAFCVPSGGLFVTNEHVVRGGDVNVVVNPGQKDEKIFKAKVVRSDADLDLALLRIEGAKDLPTLRLGSDERLAELMEVVAVGFPF